MNHLLKTHFTTHMKKALSVMFVFALALSLSSVAFAQAPGSTVGPTGGILPGSLGTQGTITSTATLVTTIMGLVNWIAWAVGLVAVVMGMYAGILFITAGGDAAKVSTARNILLYSIIGIAVAVLAFGLVAVSRSLFGI